MNGKTLKVVEYNLNFGSSDRFINVFGFFKYKVNGNLYIIYTDVDTKYELIYYGSSHEKNGNLLSMACKEEEQEIIKEFIYKIINNENLDNFEVYTLENIVGIELISSNKLEIKLEIIRKLEELTIPKKEEEKQFETQVTTTKNKKSKKTLLILLILIIIVGGGYFYLTKVINSNKVLKTINCTKTYQHDKLNATVEENNTYSFIRNDKLQTIKNISVYKFTTQTDFETFINNGDVYNYMPKSSKKYTPNQETFSIEYIADVLVDSTYQGPNEYEELISYYITNGYNCSEQIEK